MSTTQISPTTSGDAPVVYEVTQLTPNERFARWARELGWRHLVGLLMIPIVLLPILFALSMSLKGPTASLNGVGDQRMFTAFDLSTYEMLFTETVFPRWALNSLIICGITAIGTVLMGSAAAYAFSRFRFAGRRGGLTALLIVQMFPQMLAFVAIFLLVRSLGEVYPFLGENNHVALIAIYLGGALGSNAFLMYGFFNTVPRELDEAAKIDGASHAQIFWTIILRLVLPILTVVGLLSFVGTYGDFIIAKVLMTQENNYTIAVGLYQWATRPLVTPWAQFAAGAVIAAIPVIILFMFLQKYIVSGLTAGSVKG
ncbi:sugar ABC transporter permease [Flavimobilis sp. GY10621]|uniref:Sugar ABC transporter permease n=1 Tax=Flavimobilis rhizosphaerae TaxID=2775421 RepID=A0ABR9DVX1_9MICO|nr:sugar ABC transporter permease [Flavimobilis rhizosphaerae]MBD9700150.1 sugar ABC transporter permease [Flavimobilis rhizosphaerae]